MNRGAISWTNLWQIPSILLSLILIGLGLYVAASRPPGANDFGGALTQIENYLGEGRFEEAQSRLGNTIQPNLEMASSTDRARYHAIVADWVALSTAGVGVRYRENDQRIDEQYTTAVDLGAFLKPVQLQRWAEALISQGELERAKARLIELEQYAAGGEAETRQDARLRRNHVLRLLVERSLRALDISYDDLMRVLSEYRSDSAAGGLTPEDEAWAIARQAELRMEQGRPGEAVDRLLVDMRRLEAKMEMGNSQQAMGSGQSPSPNSHSPLPDPTSNVSLLWAPLYALIGRGYFDQGRYDDAKFHLDRALEAFQGPDPIRGDALVLLGRIAAAEGRFDEAYETFDSVVRDYEKTRAHLAGLLGRAEVRSILGDHERSLIDYQSVHEALAAPPGGPRGPHPNPLPGGEGRVRELRRDITADFVAQSLADRHDAALAGGALELALKYALQAEAFFGQGQTAEAILIRIAATSRQIAENLIADAIKGLDPRFSDAPGSLVGPQNGVPNRHLIAIGVPLVDVGTRSEANVHFRRAADYYIRHARALAGSPTEDQAWADSLWLAADCYDLAGRHDQAIEHFSEYLAGRSSADPRRAEATFRLAQAHEAVFEFEPAIDNYERVVQEHPRSPDASQSHVPLARCYLATNRKSEAQDQLLHVLAGERFLDPDAIDYREALLVLGKMHYDDGQFEQAIEQLNAALSRYPDDPRINEVRFRLGDAYRGFAEVLKTKAAQAAISRAEQEQLLAQRRESLESAMELFTTVINTYEKVESGNWKMASGPAVQISTSQIPRSNFSDALQQDYLRSAYLYRAGCAFDLNRFDQAIEMYDQAARKYATHHTSISALVQIVNCYEKLGDKSRAAAAHTRALLRLQQMAPETFDAPDSAMDRRAWEAWLRNIPLGEYAAASPDGSG